MGDLQFCYRQPNGVVAEDRLLPPSSSPNPDPSSIGEDNWASAEQTTQEIVFCIQPTWASEQKRKEVIAYVQRLITCCLGLEVFSYGSVPLKTYLPDGDIDLTALGSANVEEALARDVLAVLQGEEHNENAEYEVKDTQFIDAEVKLVKCLVENIVIDISFNQLGGLCTLCFLEQVDRNVGKNHFFKRSIILIKAWCYYESRILGAHHGLISTYALETLVLYIFHMFHSSLNGPLAVLYRFLDYFSKFDWENYCISLNGPVCKSSLPEIVVDLPENCREDFMLSEQFLKNCTDMFSVPSRGIDMNVRAFPQKYLDIIDPLKENNNLGRSVHRGSFYRIRSAFKFGARKLGRILQLPNERISDEVKKFFANTLQRHGSELDANLQNCALSPFHSESFSEDEMCLKLSNVDFDNISSQIEEPLSGDVNSRIAKGSSDSSPMGSDFLTPYSSQYYYAPRFYSPGSFGESGNFENGNLYQGKPQTFADEYMSCTKNREGVSFSGSAISSPDINNISESISLDFRESCLAGITGDPETLDPFSDLNGDYDGHIRSLLYGPCCHGYALSAPVLPDSPSPTSHFQNKKPWEAVCRSMPVKRNSVSQTNPNGMALGQPFYPKKNLRSASFDSVLEEKPKARGTRTYFPNKNGSYFRESPLLRKGRNQVQGNHGQLQGNFHNNGLAPAPLHMNLSKEGSHEYPHPKAAVQGIGKTVVGNFKGNGFSVSSRKLEFGSLGHLSEGNNQMAKGTSRAWVSTSNLASLEVQSSKSVSRNCLERVADKSFHLKNEDDFPPLSF